MHFREVLKNTHIDIRPFHYPEDHGGVKPNEFSIYVGPKSKISEKFDQN